jgi:MFS family permease
LAYTAEWSFNVAIGLVAYADGGAAAVGVIGVLRLLPAALLNPAVSAYADRMPRERVLMVSGTLRGAATLCIALALYAAGPSLWVYAFAIASTIAFTPFRASHSALMPLLCRTPDELTTVNVLRGSLYSASLVLGPLAAALLIRLVDVASVFVFAGLCAMVSGALVARLAYEQPVRSETGPQRLVVEMREGFRAMSNAGVRLVIGFVVLQSALRGAGAVFTVVVAIDLLGRDGSSVGILQSAVGLGALVGSWACTRLVGSRAMARWLGVAVVLWGLPLAVIGLSPSYAVAVLCLAMIGVGTALSDVTGFTLLARMVPGGLLARVYGLRESLGSVGVCLGSLAAPALIHVGSVREALLVVGVVAPVVCVISWRSLLVVDHSLAVRTDVIAMLRRVPMFRPLPVPVIEELAHAVRQEERNPGEVVLRAGEPGETFYVVARGSVDILDHEHLVRVMSTGAGFGEIALLGGVTRTMTVRATVPTILYAIDAGVFLAAVTSIREARTTAEAVQSDFLRHAPGGGVGLPDPDASVDD